MVDDQRAEERHVQPVTVTHVLTLPRADIGRGPLQVDFDFAGHPLVWSAQRIDLGYYGPGLYRFLRFDQELVGRLPIPAVQALGPRLVRPPAGWLIYSRRVDNAALENCVIYSAGGERLTAFHAGDGIADLQVTSAGAIWVSYFDEGIHGNVSPISRNGLVCFSPNGTVLYGYNQDTQRPGIYSISDCYGLNVVSERETWLYAYPEFLVVQLVDRKIAKRVAAVAWSVPQS
jgi:hypothetical protein